MRDQISQNGQPLTLDRAKRLAVQWIEAKDITLRTLLDAVGYSRSAWSGYFKSDYKGDVEKMDTALLRFIQGRINTESLVPITAYLTIQKVCDLVAMGNEIAVVYGRPGTGKTEAIKAYAQNHEGTILITCNPAMTAGELLTDILKALTDSISNYATLHTRILDIQYHLRRQSRLIILDEADKLKIRTLEMVRAVYDDGSCSLLLTGEPAIIDLLTRAKTNREDLARLYSRIGYKFEIKPPTRKEIGQILNYYGLTISKSLIKDVQAWISGNGELRMLSKLIKRSENIREWNQDLTIDDEQALRSGYNLLMGKGL